ncbi:hypothetical protein Poli38472_004170 [Pythium oligandrum]|uniref:Kinesin-like protein n=1 Tax=Pythium oligandrum TaxID=41045 RepID=A0A8K1FJT8_PYTOL|nr:hypothetical protein Poli38472_004170 [Pythium oligandrum]|eukprot:TMW66405.1 hypothetical protein Poli38472_004170 [Pythium oligandrum]
MGMSTTTKRNASTTRSMQVNVVVRVRPVLPHERQQARSLQVEKTGQGKTKGNVLTMSSPSDESHTFVFEKCYDEATPQRLLFQREIQPAIAKVLEGINTTVFAYGATGTGKTFTMEGSKRNLGMIPRAVKRLFEVAEEQKRLFQLEMSYLEIYNDRVLDLFVSKQQQTDLPIRQQPDGTIAVQGLSRKRITTLHEFEELYDRGNTNRKRAPTEMNAESSRSHSILMIQARAQDTKGSQVCFGKLHLIDLAGSEDNRRTGNTGTRLTESGKINMSLFVLGKVIMALNSGDIQRIPFRDSKLTRLLQDSLGGSSHAVMICNIAPTAGMYQESLHTLNYASKAKGIVNQVVVNRPTPQPAKKPTSVVEQKKTTSATKANTNTSAAVNATTPGSRLQRPVLSSSASKTDTTTALASKKTSLSPAQRTVSPSTAMENRLAAWKQSRAEARGSLDKRQSVSSAPSIGIKRPASSALSLPRPAATSSSLSTLPKSASSRQLLVGGALRVIAQETNGNTPLSKKPRPSVAPSPLTPAGRTSVSPKPTLSATKRTPVMKSPVHGKENTPPVNVNSATVDIITDLSPVELAKKLIGVAIDLEKKRRYSSAFCVFKRAYHVLPEENPKLVERLKALEAECPSAPSQVPSQQLATAVYMQVVLEADLLDVLNHGARSELTELPSIGDKRAEKIMASRPFTQLSDLRHVHGMTEKILDKLRIHHLHW